MRTEDGTIIYQCLNGEPGAFGILVDKYKAGIYAFVYGKLGDFQDAQDVTQEVFERAYRNLRSLRRWECFASWLYRIAVNQCKRWFQARSKRPDGEFMEDQNPYALDKPSLDAYRDNKTDESLWEALDSLSDTYREALLLHYFGGMTSKEMARALGTSPGAIRVRLNRARIHLKEEIVAMMDTAFEGQRLQASFTFRILEAVKHIKINPIPRPTALPWGLSVATGVIFTILSLSPHLTLFDPVNISTGSLLSSDAGVLKTGEISVDILNIAQMPTLAGTKKNGVEAERPQKTLLMAPRAAGEGWSEKADMIAERAQFAVSSANSKIYVFGGASVKVMKSVEEYDPITDTWKQMSNMPSARYKTAASTANRKIYVTGGMGEDIEKGLGTVEEYDPANNTWQKKADMPTPRYAHSTHTVNGKIYAIGGIDTWATTVLGTVEEYDPSNDTWTKKKDMPTARNGFASAVVNGKIYAIGGAENASMTTAVEEYDPVTDTWTQKTPMQIRRMYPCAGVVNSRIYVMGGSLRADAFRAVEVYDPTTDTWSRDPDMPKGITKACVISDNGKIYNIGGMSIYRQDPPFTALPGVMEYDTGFVPPEGSKSVAPKGKLPSTWGVIKQQEGMR